MKISFDLTQGSVGPLIRQVAIPASIGFFFNTMFNVVDTYWGGQLSTQSLAALSLSFPVYFIIIAVAQGMAVGATALIGAALGKNDPSQARLYFLQAVMFSALLGIGLTFLGLIVAPSLFGILGATGEYLDICLDYMNVIFFGAVFFVLNFVVNSLLNARGDTRPFRNFLIVGSILNIGLDPWFIYGGFGLPAMGIAGIALATILIQALGLLYLVKKCFDSGLLEHIHLKRLLPKPAIITEIAYQGLPASCNFATIGIGIFVITYFFSLFGKAPVAAYGVATRIEQIILLPSIGLNIATLSIVAQNCGAGRYDRIHETLNTALRYGFVIMALGTAIVFFFANPLVTLFTDDPAVIDIGTDYLRVMAFLLYAYVVLFVHVAALQGMKLPMFAIYIGLFRQLLAPAALFSLFAVALDFRLPGIWWSVFVINWLSAGISFFYARRVLNAQRGCTEKKQ
ncbi:MATE family efflux transporter [Desulfovibrio inopinatus]|uniref:MATE family efflux transporter n=1 Tax=Desulfovibrio inopinatus TaxID=102109 RepID=UPI0004178329|nr:MATE family efflux transporter [Desulfovibrio inopinatus]